MKVFAVCFDAYTYNREELAKMSDKEKYDSASAASTFGYDEAQILELGELSGLINDDMIDFVNTWVYFVKVED